MSANDPLLRSFSIKGLQFKNRVVSTPHAPAYAEDGKPKQRYQLYHEEKAKGGLAMTMFGGSSCVGPDSPSVFGQLYVGDDSIIPYFQEFSERIHKHDCALICQISHLGRRTVWNAADWLPITAPSRVREPQHRGFPKEMDQDDIQRIIGYYADAARRCKEGGLDGCEVLGHGHLPGQFFSPHTNKRSDGYGGTLENRMRFTMEMFEAIRDAVGDDFVLGFRHGMSENFEGGYGFEEAVVAGQILEESGLIDYISVTFGRIDTDHGLAHHMPGMWSKMAPWLPYAALFREEVHLPLMHACRIADVATARYAIEEGLLDLVGMTRAHIADPHIVRKIIEGREAEIRPCVGAGYCVDRIYNEGETLCLHNAATGREATIPHQIPKAEQQAKKAMVVGGGPAGLEAARVLAERGHKVTLLEASGELGGQILLAAKASWRRDLIGIVEFYKAEMARLGVEVRWNCFAETTDIEAENPDIVVIATGGLPDSNYVEGGENCLSVWDVLSGSGISGSVLVYDDNGQHQGPSCADYLSDKEGVQVELVTPDRQVVAEMGTLNYPIYMQHFYKKGVVMTPDYRLQTVTREGNKLKAQFTNEFGGPDIERVVDHIVIEHGTLPLDGLYHELRSQASNRGVTDYEALLDGRPQQGAGEGFLLFRVGDAVTSRNIHAAIYDSLRLCKDL